MNQLTKNPAMLALIVAIVVGGGAFYGGMRYQTTQKNSNQYSGNGGMMRRNGQGGNGNFRPVSGDIISIDEKSLTVKMQDGSSKIIVLSDSTTITEATSATKQALQTGKKVAVFGTENSDGSVTAQNIQLNPQGRGMMGGSR